MSYNIEARAFDPVTRGALIASTLGEVIPDLLGSITVIANPYTADAATVGSVTTYTIEVSTISIEDNVQTTTNFSYTSTGLESYKELIEAIVDKGTTDFSDTLSWNAQTDYINEEDMYFTLTSKEGHRISSLPVLSNINVTSEEVSAPVGKPAAYLAHQKITTPQYPLLLVTPLPITSVSENWDKGSVFMDIGDGRGERWYPYYDSYVQFACRITVESGSYDNVVKSNVKSAECILQILKMRLKESNAYTTFVEKVDATYNQNMTVTPSPVVGSTEWMSIAGMTMNLDIIDRYIDTRGGVITKVEITNSDLRQKGSEDVGIVTDQTIERTDVV